jgi:hypothetical protein
MVITNYSKDLPPPHIHVRYGDDRAAVSIASGEPLYGAFPPRAAASIILWVRLHHAELVGNWAALARGGKVSAIEPLA